MAEDDLDDAIGADCDGGGGWLNFTKTYILHFFP